ncbi:hypothetical protein [Streptomyces plumbiresistens]|uniref:hypothetical protein n=1 Tax=Streptomyces plumbiresistens TaxID=511811 RepID=UPI0031EB79F2
MLLVIADDVTWLDAAVVRRVTDAPMSSTTLPSAVSSGRRRPSFVTNLARLAIAVSRCPTDLVLFSGSLSQAALTTGDSHPGQGRRLLRISLDRLSSRDTAPQGVQLSPQRALFARRCRIKKGRPTLLREVRLAPFADDPAVGQVVEVHGLHRDLVAEVSLDDHQVTATRRAPGRIPGNDGRRHRSQPAADSPRETAEPRWKDMS